jgi:cytochrome c
MTRYKAIRASALLITGVSLFLMGMVPGDDNMDAILGYESGPLGIIVAGLDPTRGKELFIEKGCVICHSINGVGGRAATPLDAQSGTRVVDILDFAARMWRGSYAMIELQATELAYQIDLEGDEIGDLAAFAYDLRTQQSFTKFDIPESFIDRIVNEPFSVEGGLFDDKAEEE